MGAPGGLPLLLAAPPAAQSMAMAAPKRTPAASRQLQPACWSSSPGLSQMADRQRCSRCAWVEALRTWGSLSLPLDPQLPARSTPERGCSFTWARGRPARGRCGPATRVACPAPAAGWRVQDPGAWSAGIWTVHSAHCDQPPQLVQGQRSKLRSHRTSCGPRLPRLIAARTLGQPAKWPGRSSMAADSACRVQAAATGARLPCGSRAQGSMRRALQGTADGRRCLQRRLHSLSAMAYWNQRNDDNTRSGGNKPDAALASEHHGATAASAQNSLSVWG